MAHAGFTITKASLNVAIMDQKANSQTVEIANDLKTLCHSTEKLRGKGLSPGLEARGKY